MTPTNREVAPKWPFLLAKTSSAIAIIVGALILLCWTFYYWLPDNIAPIILAFKPNAAICFILSGMALWIRSDRKEGYERYLAD